MAKNAFLDSPLETVTESINEDRYSLPTLPEVKAPEAPKAEARQPRAESWLPNAELRPIFDAAAREFNVPVNVLMALGHQESRYNPNAVGPATEWGRAKGVLQYLDSTAKGLGINPFDPAQAIPAAAKQLKERLDKGYSMEDAVKEHFAGPDRKLWGEKTDAYGREVMEKVGRIGSLIGAGEPGQSAPPTDVLAEMNKAEPGRYRTPTAEELSAFEAQQSPALPEAPKQEEGDSSFIGDVGRNLKIGMNIAAQDMRELVSRIPGVGPSIVSGADAVDKYFSGKTSEELLKSDTENMQQGLSPAMKGALKKEWWDSEKGTFGPAWSDPKAYIGGVTQSLPEQAVLMIPSMRLAKLAYAGRVAAGASQAVAAQAAARTAMIAGGITEGAMGGAQAARSVRDDVMELKDDVLNQSDAYQALITSGMRPDQAKKALAEDLATRAFVTSGVATGIFGGMGDRVIAKILVDKVGQGVVRRAVGGFVKGAVGEGIFEELPQSALQQVAQNEALQKADPSKALTEGVANQALGGLALGGIQGGGMGGVAGAMSSGQPAPPPPPTTQTVTVTPPAPSQAPGPLTRAVENTAEQPARVTVKAPEGEISGFVQSHTEDSNGNTLTRVLGDDGQVYTFSSADGVQITPEAGPLTSALEKTAESVVPVQQTPAQEAAAPAQQPDIGIPMSEQDQQVTQQDQSADLTASEAEAPIPMPPAVVPERDEERRKPIDEMDEQELRERMKYLAGQYKRSSDNAVRRRIATERKQVEAAISKLAKVEPATPAASEQKAPEPEAKPEQAAEEVATEGEVTEAQLQAYNESVRNARDRQFGEGKRAEAAPAQSAQQTEGDGNGQGQETEVLNEAGAAEAAPVEPWQMKRDEFIQSAIDEKPKKETRGFGLNRTVIDASSRHAESVSKAISEGKPVPVETLADYPELAAPVTEANTSAEPVKETPKSEQVGTVVVPQPVVDAMDGQMRKQKSRITRLKNEANKAESLDDKRAALLKVTAAEATLRKMRTSRFDAEDAAIKAVETGDMAAFAEHADIYSDAAVEIEKLLGQNDELDAEMRSYERKAEEQQQAANDDTPPKGKPEVSENKIFTDDAAEKARALLKSKLGQINSGIDPEIMQAGITLAGYHVERGARTFAAYAKAMVDDLGEAVKPYLKSWYSAIVFDPRASGFEGLTPIGEVQAADINAILSETPTGPILEVKENGDGNPTQTPSRAGDRALEGVSADQVRDPQEGGGAEQRSPDGGGTDAGRASNADSAGVPGRGGVGDGAREVSVPARGGRGKRRGASQSGVQAELGIEQPAAGDVTPEEAVAAARDADVAQAREKPIAGDYRITDLTRLGEGGQKTKYRNNVSAIRLLNELQASGRKANSDEQDTLARYVGWGGIAQAFDPNNAEWSKEYAELKELLTPEEWEAAKESTQYAHYTSQQIIDGMYSALNRMGFGGGLVLEPGAGVGNFMGLMPENLRAGTRFTAVERERIAGGIAKMLYPNHNIQQEDFRKFNAQDGYFDVALGNPPFAATALTDLTGRKHLSGLSVHNYFFGKSIDMLREGGVLSMVVSNSFLDAKTDKARRYIGERTEFLGAIRLPNNAFAKNAHTEVTTDIIFLRKRPESEWGSKAAKDDMKRWQGLGLVADPLGGEAIPLNQYFVDHPEMMLGRMKRAGSMYRADQPALVAKDGQDTEALLKEAINRLPENVYTAPTLQNNETIQDAEIVALADDAKVDIGGHYVKDGDLFVRMNDVAGEGRAMKVTATTKMSEKRDLGENGLARLKQLAEMRVTVRNLLSAEIADAGNMDELRAKLNEQYDGYVKANGYINQRGTVQLFGDDPDFPLLASLEHGYDPGISAAAAKSQGVKAQAPKATKAPIFTRRVIEKHEEITSADTPEDALMVSIAERGRIDPDYIGRLLGRDGAAVLDQLTKGAKPALFIDPATRSHVLRDAYLSGNVRKKLEQAKAAGMYGNVAELEKVIPEDIPAHEISGKIGAPWVPPEVYEQFASEIMGEGTKARIVYVPAMSSYIAHFEAGSDVTNTNTFGTGRMGADELYTALLNSKEIKVGHYEEDPASRSRRFVLEKEPTDEANDKAREIKDKFNDWLFSDSDRAEKMQRAYNDAVNNYVTREFDGSMMKFPGKVPDSIIRLRRHQRNAVSRIIQDGTALLDHVVGAGKTYTIIAAAMELKRTGLAKKPMIAVPNHLVKQWAADFYRLYPGANILTATKKDFEKANRRKFLAKIATGNWDSVIIAHSSYGFIKPDQEFELAFNQERIDEILEAIEALKDEQGQESKRTVKQLAKMQESLENKLDSLRDKPMDDLLDFGQLGVDQLFVDEAHLFKNLMFVTKMQNVRGLGQPKGSQRAYDMFIKTHQIYNQNGGARGVVFATGTPVSNSLAEMYHMLRYLAPQSLKDAGQFTFDAWAKTFADVEQVWMQSMSGDGYKSSNRMSRFVNTPELLRVFDQVADTVTIEDIKAAYSEENNGAEFPIPKLKGGRRTPVSIPISANQKEYMGEIAKRAKELEQRKGKPQKGDDNMLSIMGDARKAAMDIRMVRQDIKERDPNGRLGMAANNIFDRYQKYNDVRGTQLVFSDMGTPKKQAEKELKEYNELMAAVAPLNDEKVLAMAELGDEAAQDQIDKAEDAQRTIDAKGQDWLDAIRAAMRGFSVYDDLKDALVEKGIPENQIAFIHDYNTDDQKAALFRAVNDGKVRVLLGSTEKMGAGTNVQERLVAEHHLDVPWKPSDIEQREGRIIRQGNKLMDELGKDFEVEVMAYATQDTLDLFMWQTQEKKLSMIAQLRTGNVGREVDNAFEEMQMSAGEMQAAATSNPYLLEEIQLKDKVKRLERQKRSFEGQKNDLINRKKKSEREIAELPAKIAASKKVEKTAKKTMDDIAAHFAGLKATINGQTITGSAEIRQGLRDAIAASPTEKNGKEVREIKIEFNGKEYTSESNLAEAANKALGDAAEIAYTLPNGETVYRGADVIAGLVDPIANMVETQTETAELGNVGAFEVTAYRVGEGKFEISTALNGDEVASYDMRFDPAEPGALNSHIRAIPGHVQGGIKAILGQSSYLEYRLESAKKTLADVESKPAAGAWDGEAELQKAREDYRGVLKKLGEKEEAAAPTTEAEDGPKFSVSPDQTETPAFKRWFGDSKVVDENGDPLVVYHGTGADFTAFDLGRVGDNYQWSKGFYFAGSPDAANEYAMSHTDAQPARPGIPGVFAGMPADAGRGGANIIPVYLSMKNPLVKRARGNLSPDQAADRNIDKWVAEARAAGNDGLIVRAGNAFGERGDVFIAFRPEQIKSAIGNRGTFDPKNPDIRYSVGEDGKTVAEFGPVTEEFRDDPAGAVAHLMSQKTGEAIINHPTLGEISIVYGDDGKGLAHISNRRGASYIKRIPDLLENGTIYTKEGQNGRLFIGTDTDEAAIRLDWDGGAKTWLVSAYEKHPDLNKAKDVSQARRSQIVAERADKGMTPKDLRKSLTTGLIGPVVDAMIENGLIVLHKTEKTLPNGVGKNVKGIRGVVLHDGKMHLVASNIDRGGARGVQLHEAFHAFVRDSIGGEQWSELMGRGGSLYRQAQQSNGKLGKVLKRALDRVAAAKRKGAVSTANEVEEFLAYAIEEYERAPESLPAALRKWVEDFLGFVKAFLVKKWGIQAGKITPAQLAAFAKFAVMDVAAQNRREMFGPLGELFSLREPDAGFAAAAMVDLAAEDDLYSFDTSSAKSLKGVFDAVMPDAEYVGEVTAEDERKESGADHKYHLKTSEGSNFYVFTNDDGRVWIDVSRLEEGGGGQQIYWAVANYALNNRMKFVGDPSGLSEAAVARRTANMLATALRFGTTEHIEPAKQQLWGAADAGITPLEWEGNDFDKLKSMIHTHVDTVINAMPELGKYRYDFANNRFTDRSGRPIRSDFATDLAATPVARAHRIGSKTISRVVFLQSLMDTENADQPRTMAALLRRSGEIAQGTGPLFSVTPEEATEALGNAEEAIDAKPIKDDYIGRVVGDMSLGARLLVHPRTVAATHKEFTPVYRTAISQMETRDKNIADFGADVKAYDHLDQAGKENVNKVLELGRLTSQTYTAQELQDGVSNTGDKSVVVMVDGKPQMTTVPVEALLTQPGEVVKLTQEEAQAYLDLRKMFDRALDKLRDQTLEELGFEEFKDSKSAARDIMASITPSTPPATAEKLQNIAKFVSEIEQAKRAGYVPFARYGDYVVTVKEKIADAKYLDNGDDRYIVQGLPDSFAEDMLEMGATPAPKSEGGGWYIQKSQKGDVEKLTEKTIYSTKVETGLGDKLAERRAGKVDDIPAVKEAIEKARADWITDNPNRRIVAFKVREKKSDQPVKLSDVDALAEVASIDNATWDAVRDKLADAIKSKGFRRHFFHSDNVPGYTGDFERSIADYVIGMSGYLSRRQHMKRWENTVSAIQDKPKLFNYASKYRDYVNNPQEELAMVRQIGFFSYIAGVMASAFANLTQVPLMSVPTLSQVAPTPLVMKELTRAYKDAASMLSSTQGLDMFDPEKAPADVREILKEAWAEGSFVPLESFDLMMTARQRNVGARKGTKAFNKATQLVALGFTFAERMNRLVTFIAAARLAEKRAVQENAKKVLSKDALARAEVLRDWNPKNFAEWAVDESQYRMGKANRPTTMRGVGSAILQFKGFMLQTFEAWYRMAALHGPEGKKAAAASILALAALSGVWGLPGADDLRKLLEDLYKTLSGKDLDLKTELRAWIARKSGSNALSQMVTKGASYPLGVDLTRVGMGNVVPDSPLSAAGIPFDMLIGRPTRAFEKFSAGDELGGVGELTPNFMKHWLASGSWALEGVRDKQGNRILRPDQLSNKDLAMKALGFQPSIVTDVRDYEYAQRRQETAVDALKRSYVNKLAKAFVKAELATNAEEAKEADDEITVIYNDLDEHNADAAPEAIIKIDQRSLRAKIMREREGVEATWGKERKAARGAAEELRGVFGLSKDDDE